MSQNEDVRRLVDDRYYFSTRSHCCEKKRKDENKTNKQREEQTSERIKAVQRANVFFEAVAL